MTKKDNKTTQVLLFALILLVIILIIGVFSLLGSGVSNSEGNVIVQLG